MYALNAGECGCGFHRFNPPTASLRTEIRHRLCGISTTAVMLAGTVYLVSLLVLYVEQEHSTASKNHDLRKTGAASQDCQEPQSH